MGRTSARDRREKQIDARRPSEAPSWAAEDCTLNDMTRIIGAGKAAQTMVAATERTDARMAVANWRGVEMATPLQRGSA
jgi:hypothetical protein